jgi:hypothetical protein
MPHRSNAMHETETEHPDVARDDDELKVVEDLTEYFKKYARERPQTVALLCLGVGFVLGWKMKPW